MPGSVMWTQPAGRGLAMRSARERRTLQIETDAYQRHRFTAIGGVQVAVGYVANIEWASRPYPAPYSRATEPGCKVRSIAEISMTEFARS